MTFIILLSWPARSATVTAWLPRRHTGIRGCDEVLRRALMPRLGGITAHLPAMRRSQPGCVPGPERARAGQRPLGDTCGWPEHACGKMPYCVRGQIVFRAAGGGIELGPADNTVLQGFTAAGRFLPAWAARDHDLRRGSGQRRGAGREETTSGSRAGCWPAGELTWGYPGVYLDGRCGGCDERRFRGLPGCAGRRRSR
jgi:hypothetical protein